MKGEQKVLDYHDVLLYKSDSDLLTAPYWLNDQVLVLHGTHRKCVSQCIV